MAMTYYHRVLICGMTQCLSSDTEVLSKDGWCSFGTNKEILIYDLKSNEFKWETPELWNVYDGSHECYHITSKKDELDQIVTSSHRVVHYIENKIVISTVLEIINSGVKEIVVPILNGKNIDKVRCTISEKFTYLGTVFCPTVSTGCFVAKRVGKPFITGNSGKTTFLKEGIVPYLPRWVAYDPDLHFGDIKGVKICRTYDDFEDSFPFENKIAFQPEDDVMGNFDRRVAEFEQVCERVNRLGVKMTFIIDEIAHVTLRRDRAIIPPELQKMIKRRMKEPTPDRPQGRIGVYLTTQRPKDAAVDFLTQCQHIIAFKLLPRDVKYVKEAFPVGVDIDDIINYKLGKFQAIHYEVDTQDMYYEELDEKQAKKLRSNARNVDDESVEDFLDLMSKKDVFGLQGRR